MSTITSIHKRRGRERSCISASLFVDEAQRAAIRRRHTHVHDAQNKTAIIVPCILAAILQNYHG